MDIPIPENDAERVAALHTYGTKGDRFSAAE
jgi:hypothetical protein